MPNQVILLLVLLVRVLTNARRDALHIFTFSNFTNPQLILRICLHVARVRSARFAGRCLIADMNILEIFWGRTKLLLRRLTSFRPERVFFPPASVNLRSCLCGVPMYASAQPLDFLDRRKNPRFPKRKLAVSRPEFPDGN